MKSIWILDEGSQGHLVQSRGLIRELGKAMSLELSEIPIHCILPRRVSRSVVKRLLRLFPQMWLFRILHPAMKLPPTAPELIVSSGPHSLAALAFLSKHYVCPSVFVQGTVNVPEGEVSVIMRPFEGIQRNDFIFIPLLFTEITPQVVEQAKAEYLAAGSVWVEGPVNTLFIGNSSAKIRFSAEDWNGIARFVNDAWRNDGTRWLITSSYRTGRELEDHLRSQIEQDAILDAVWYSQNPRKVTKAFLGMAGRVFVTMDSLTMLTEAVASQRPVFALCPSEMPDMESNSHLQYVRRLAGNGLISLIRPGIDTPQPSEITGIHDIDYTAAIRQLLTRLHWTP